jgi:hypothetical protein
MRFGRDGVPPHRHVEVTSLGAWIRERLGHDPLRDAMSAVDWLALPQQRVLEVVAGPVFRDDTGELSRLRRLLAWYPEDVWWWLLAAQWRAVAEEEAFVQRTAEVGDRLGSAVEAARLVRLAMRLALLLARRYAPYPKWLGTAFARLDDPEGLGEVLTRAVAGGPVSEVEASLGRGWQILATRFNQLTAGPGLDTSLRPFHDRPAIVIGADRFVAAALNRVRDPKLLALPLTGAIDQVVDNVAVLTSPDQARRLRGLWEPVG